MIAKLTVTILVAMTAAIQSGTTKSPPPESAPKQPATPAKQSEANKEADKNPKTTTHDIPEWAYDARWYQLDIARFRYADPRATSPSDATATADEASRVGTARQGTATESTIRKRVPGNIAGLTEQLPYLTELGVNTLYLTPIFRRVTSPMGTSEYDMRHVSDELGDGVLTASSETWDATTWKPTATDHAFVGFVKDAHQAGFRVILAAPFFHADWGGASNADTRRRMLATTHHWMDPNGDGKTSDGIDGWVVRGPLAYSNDFWKRWRAAAKKTNPNVLLVADGIEATIRWIGDGRFDLAVNRSTATVVWRTRAVPYLLPQERKRVANALRPLGHLADQLAATWLDDHPKAELAAPMVAGEQKYWSAKRSSLPYDNPAGAERNSPAESTSVAAADAPDRAAWRLGIILRYFLPGAPVVNFGEEMGTRGDHMRREDHMWWPDGPSTPKGYRPEFASLVQWLNFRRSLLAPLRRGSVRTIMADDDTGMLVFARTLPDGEVVLAMNLSKTKRQVAVPAGKPGELAHILTPELVPSGKPVPRFPGRKSADGDKKKPSRITPLRLGGIRQFVNAEGKLSIWVGPQSVRVILLGSASPSE